MDTLSPLPDVVRRFRLLATVDERTRLLQQLIGAPTHDAGLLHRRALLITALSENHLWPASTGRT